MIWKIIGHILKKRIAARETVMTAISKIKVNKISANCCADSSHLFVSCSNNLSLTYQTEVHDGHLADNYCYCVSLSIASFAHPRLRHPSYYVVSCVISSQLYDIRAPATDSSTNCRLHCPSYGVQYSERFVFVTEV